MRILLLLLAVLNKQPQGYVTSRSMTRAWPNYVDSCGSDREYWEIKACLYLILLATRLHPLVELYICLILLWLLLIRYSGWLHIHCSLWELKRAQRSTRVLEFMQLLGNLPGGPECLKLLLCLHRMVNSLLLWILYICLGIRWSTPHDKSRRSWKSSVHIISARVLEFLKFLVVWITCWYY